MMQRTQEDNLTFFKSLPSTFIPSMFGITLFGRSPYEGIYLGTQQGEVAICCGVRYQ